MHRNNETKLMSPPKLQAKEHCIPPPPKNVRSHSSPKIFLKRHTHVSHEVLKQICDESAHLLRMGLSSTRSLMHLHQRHRDDDDDTACNNAQHATE